MVEEAAGLLIERRDRREIVLIQLEIEDREVLGHAFLADGFRDGGDAALVQPAQDDLRDALA